MADADDRTERVGAPEAVFETQGLDRAPAYGPYCPITGERVWAWYTQVLAIAHHALSLVAIFVGANHLHTELYGADSPGRSRAVLLWVALATIVYVAGWFFARLGFAMRTLLAIGATIAVVVAWSDPQPVVFADPELAWTVALDDERRAWDTFLAEAGFPTALVLFALAYALCSVLVTASTVRSVARSWNLPRHLWFARYHPVWRRRYAPSESAYPLAGVLSIVDDELLTDKLVFLMSKRRDAAFRFAPPLLASDPPSVPLGALAAPFVIWRDGEHWWSSASPMQRTGAPFRLRMLFEAHDLPVADADEAALVAPSDPHDLPVRDLLAKDEACIAKHYDDAAERPELFGVLFDSRPHVGGPELPRFTTLVQRCGRVHAEHPHPDLLGTPHFDNGRVLMPWRGADAEPIAIDLDGAHDSIHFVESAEGDGYHLFFLAFAPHRG